MRIARVFPRITKATPRDELAYFSNNPPLIGFPEVDEIHISVTFTYDKAKAEDIAENWRWVGVPVKVDAPAYGKPAGEFVPGRYMKIGYTFTSRGCDNNCWFCKVPKRQGKYSKLQIKDGWIICDDNFLEGDLEHILAVEEMLLRQPEKPEFVGGLEAKILKSWHIEMLKRVKTRRMYFAYDTPDDYEPLVQAGKMLRDGGFTFESHSCGCYVLLGYQGDTFEKAEKRLIDTIKAGFVPYAMLFKDDDGNEDKTWRRFQREWLRREIVGTKIKELGIKF